MEVRYEMLMKCVLRGLNGIREQIPLHVLAPLLKSGEEPAAIRALVGKFSPDPTESAAMVDQLLLRWRKGPHPKAQFTDCGKASLSVATT